MVHLGDKVGHVITKYVGKLGSDGSAAPLNVSFAELSLGH